MLINGKEIQYDEKQAISIQKGINAIDDIKGDLKSGVKPESEDSKESEISFSGWNIFEKEDEQLINRKTRYGYFREMDEMEFIHRAIEIVADDSTQTNDNGNAIKFYSSNEKIKELLEDLFFNRLDINNEIWSIFFETCKMGDNFFEVVVDDYKKPKKVVMIRYLEPDKVERIEKDGKLSHFNYKRKTTTKEEKEKGEEIVYKLQPWQIIHFKLENKQYDPYGGSLLYPGIKTFRRLSLLEDVMLVYRLSRAPERRVFYIDVGNLNAVQAKQFLQKIKNTYRTQPFIDEEGKINKKAHMMSITSDIFVPVREGTQGTRIENLPGGEALHNIDDLKYFRDKILKTMNIPAAYLGDETDRSRGSLCLHPSTKIKLADGRNISIKKITEEFKNGKDNYVYSINEDTLQWEINKIVNAQQTRKNAELVEVLLDNGEKIVCTPDHPFMLRDGTYCTAENLECGNSLMPIYTKHSTKNIHGYEMILDNNSQEWIYTHRINKKTNINEVVHHADFNNSNNLEIIDKAEKNHKVVSIKKLTERSDTYDITVENSHNFATTAGVVLHNSQLDIKFSKFIERVQSQIIKGLNKIAVLELFFNKFKKNDLNNFQIELTPPSNIKEVTELDMINQRITLLQNIQQLNIFSTEWMLRNVLKMSSKEIADIELYKKLEQPAQEGGAVPGEAGLEMPVVDAGEEGEVPAEVPGETPAEAPAEAPPEELAASTIIDMFGKEFIIENAKDFKKLLIAANDYNINKNNTNRSEFVSIIESLIISKNKKKRVSERNGVENLLIINELGGLNFESGEMKLWEGKIYKRKEENTGRYRLKKILRG
jgi:hypothetical protein